MDAQARADAPGEFASLSNGITHYQFHGPVDGPLVVCVHGLTTPSFVYEGLAKRLMERGYRVLVYDHYGRGYSDRPKGDQDRAFFVSHLEELLEHLNIDTPFDLVGYSMGGWVVTAYAAIHPTTIKRLFLLAPAGMGHELGWTAKLVRDVTIVELAKSYAYIDLAYIGSVSQLGGNLGQRGLVLAEGETGWTVITEESVVVP